MARITVNMPDSIRQRVEELAQRLNRKLGNQVLSMVKNHLGMRPQRSQEGREEEFEIRLTEKELDFLVAIITNLEELFADRVLSLYFKTTMNFKKLCDRIFQQYHDPNGESCHMNRRGEIVEFKGKVCEK